MLRFVKINGFYRSDFILEAFAKSADGGLIVACPLLLQSLLSSRWQFKRLIPCTNVMISLLPPDAEEAYSRIIEIGNEFYEKNPLFTVCGYICGLCEKECNYKDQTGAVRSRMLKRFLTDYYLSYLDTKPPLPSPTKEKVAVCPYDATRLEKSDAGLVAVIDDLKCKRCGLCVTACPAGAITIKDSFAETVADTYALL